MAQTDPHQVGEILAKALFLGETLSLYERCLDLFEGGTQTSMRLELIFDLRDSNPLHSLPWELLVDPLSLVPLSLNPRTSLVRYLRVPLPLTAADRPQRLRVLAVAADPRLPGFPPLNLQEEFHALQTAFAGNPRVEIVVLSGVQSLAALRSALVEHQCHILHFMGHGGRPDGSNEQVLFFEGERRSPDLVNGPALLAKLAGLPTLRLVVLNACESGRVPDGGDLRRPLGGIAATLIYGRLPAVIAMQGRISDSAATLWSKTFYGCLAAGATVDAAMAEGRQAVHSANRKNFEWAIPVLYSRSQTGELFPVRDVSPDRPLRNRSKPLLVVALVALFLSLSLVSWARHWQAVALVSQGAADFFGKDWDAARTQFDKAKVLSPKSPEITANLALAEERLGEVQAAEDHYREAVLLTPESSDRLYDLGHFLNDRNNWVEAYSTLLRALTLDPRRPETYAELARAAVGLRLFGRARMMIGFALKLDPDRALFHHQAGEIELAAGRPRTAIRNLEAAFHRYPAGDREQIETLALLAIANDREGNGPAACQWVTRFQIFDAVGISSRAPEIEELAIRRHCPFSHPDVVDASPRPGDDSTTAEITQIGGAVEILGAGTDLPLAARGQIAPAGAKIRVPEGGSAGVVCSDRHFVRISGPAVWSVSQESCARGWPLSESQFALIAPKAGRFQVVSDILVLERQLQVNPRLDPRNPLIISPRKGFLRSFQPTVITTRVPTADMYIVEWWRSDGARDELLSRTPVIDESCRGGDFCSFPWDSPNISLRPGGLYLISVLARDRETGILTSEPPTEISVPDDDRSQRVQTEMAQLENLGFSGWDLKAARAGVLAQQSFFTDAIEAYRKVLTKAPSPEIRVTLADLYFTVELNDLAMPLYTEVLESDSPAAQAAAAFGLGRVEYEKKNYREAAGRFEQAGKGYARLKLADEEEAANSAERRADYLAPRQ